MRDVQDWMTLSLTVARLKMAALLFVVAFLPYAVSRDYIPTPNGVMGRTMLLGALCHGVLIASVICWMGRRVGYVVLAGYLVVFAIMNQQANRAYAQVFYHENQTLNQSQDILKKRKHITEFRIAPVALRFGRYNYAEGFVAQWDFNSALALATGRTDLKGGVYLKP